ncbi:MAG: hypothetical protein F4X31_03355 [Gammaproteobacteria bacterium]|nr:hypothetical protein [Gammaproteobacteria bacterium]MYF52066.1 hypothetical protein [Gammaproteobacteria bacterium]MYH15516.1 hypothetical protein [Gammaproteobacteria bacterium]MYK83744.1 hypothetical protein [Gammaproteobacteria bacterium]
MQINPGGRLNTQEVMGRDREIARYWDILGRQGLVLSAERRIGKTHIALKMRDECGPRYLPFYQDLEGVHSINELIRSIYDTVRQSLATAPRFKARLATWSTLLPDRIGGIDIPTGSRNWQILLATAFDDLINISEDKIILMLWDEFPLMLHNLQRREGPDSAIELLDHLRALRLAHSNRLRFLYTGSIGLHLVLRSLRKAGNANDPVNDMHSATVPPMTHRDTCDLAAALLKETLAPSDLVSTLASLVAEEVGGFPYYVHHVVDQLHQLRRPITPDDIVSAVGGLIHDPHDPANFQYYVNRLSAYYDAADRGVTLMVLDTMAGLEQAAPVSQLVNLCRHRDPSLTEEYVREALKLMAEDHYVTLKRTKGGLVYDFRWQLVKRWWKETRL